MSGWQLVLEREVKWVIAVDTFTDDGRNQGLARFFIHKKGLASYYNIIL